MKTQAAGWKIKREGEIRTKKTKFLRLKFFLQKTRIFLKNIEKINTAVPAARHIAFENTMEPLYSDHFLQWKLKSGWPL